LTDSGLTDFDLYLFGEGKHERIYDKLGAHTYGPPLGAMFLIGPA
jgi:1,4-alpha-glucan branching enzyme